MEQRLTRRVAGVLHSRLPEAGFEHVPDPRREVSVKWPLPTILKMGVTGILARCRSLAHLEHLSDEMSPSARKLLDLPKRLPDTTIRDTLVKLEPDALRAALYRQIRKAVRRKALRPEGLPFGVVSLDGKFTAIEDTKSKYVSFCRNKNDAGEYGKLGTVTTTLISAAAKPCLDARPIGGGWGEETVYDYALHELLDAYGSLDLFKLVVYDAGACSMVNARSTREAGLHYMFRIKKGKQPKLAGAAEQELGARGINEADAVVDGDFNGQPERRSVYLSENISTWPRWTQMRTVIRVLWELLDSDGNVVKKDNRYYVSSLSQNALTPKQWIAISRGHWAVENNCHHTFDTVFKEDTKPWISADAVGMLAVLLLRRIAYNILTLYRTVTQRSATGRHTPWRDLCRWFYNMLLVVNDDHIEGLRVRKRTADGI
jgi:hypothetical protein